MRDCWRSSLAMLGSGFVVVGLVCAGSASAATLRIRTPDAGPVVAGKHVVWGDRTPTGHLRLLAWQFGERPKVILDVKPPRSARARHRWISLAASPQRIATRYATETLIPFPHRSSTVAFPPGAPTHAQSLLLAGALQGGFVALEKWSGSDGESECRAGIASLGDPQVEGDVIAYTKELRSCGRRDAYLRDEVVVRDLAKTGLAQVIRRSPSHVEWGEQTYLSNLRMAGGLLAWVDEIPGGGDQVAHVYDWRRRRPVYSVRAYERPRKGQLSSLLEWFDLQSDGKLLVSTHGKEGEHQLGWISRRKPWLHRLQLIPPSGFGNYEPETVAVRIRGDRAMAVVEDSTANRFRLVVGTLAGGLSRRLDTFSRRRPLVGNPDFNGHQISWVTRQSPSRGVLHVASITKRRNSP